MAYKIVFYPSKPHFGYVILKILKNIGGEVVELTDSCDSIMSWKDNTYKKYPSELYSIKPKKEVINGNCLDISKKHVDKIYKEVFGITTEIDPLKYNGKYVCKFNRNGYHFGIVCKKPHRPLPFLFYQKLIDTKKEKYFFELRLPIIKNSIPFVYEKYKSPIHRFFNFFGKSSIAPFSKYFTDKDKELILEFCRKIGLDYGELDILEENNQYYITDVNPTPVGLPNGLPKKQVKEAINLMSDEFEKEFLTRKPC